MNMTDKPLSRRKRLRRWWDTRPFYLRVLLRAIAWIVVFSLLTQLGSWLVDRKYLESLYVGLVAGFVISVAVETRMRVRGLERVVSESAIRSLVATLADGRTIWINDEEHTYESPPKNKTAELNR